MLSWDYEANQEPCPRSRAVGSVGSEGYHYRWGPLSENSRQHDHTVQKGNGTEENGQGLGGLGAKNRRNATDPFHTSGSACRTCSAWNNQCSTALHGSGLSIDNHGGIKRVPHDFSGIMSCDLSRPDDDIKTSWQDQSKANYPSNGLTGKSKWIDHSPHEGLDQIRLARIRQKYERLPKPDPTEAGHCKTKLSTSSDATFMCCLKNETNALEDDQTSLNGSNVHHPFWDPDFWIPRRPLARDRIYHFHVLYNHARSKLSGTEDTNLALRVTTALVSRLEMCGYVNSYFHERDRRSQNTLSTELERVMAGASATILLLTPGFLHDCLAKYLGIPVFRHLLAQSGPHRRLIVLSVGVARDQVPEMLTPEDVLYFSQDWEVDIPTWTRFDEAVRGTLRASGLPIPWPDIPHETFTNSASRLKSYKYEQTEETNRYTGDQLLIEDQDDSCLDTVKMSSDVCSSEAQVVETTEHCKRSESSSCGCGRCFRQQIDRYYTSTVISSWPLYEGERYEKSEYERSIRSSVWKREMDGYEDEFYPLSHGTMDAEYNNQTPCAIHLGNWEESENDLNCKQNIKFSSYEDEDLKKDDYQLIDDGYVGSTYERWTKSSSYYSSYLTESCREDEIEKQEDFGDPDAEVKEIMSPPWDRPPPPYPGLSQSYTEPTHFHNYLTSDLSLTTNDFDPGRLDQWWKLTDEDFKDTTSTSMYCDHRKDTSRDEQWNFDDEWSANENFENMISYDSRWEARDTVDRLMERQTYAEVSTNNSFSWLNGDEKIAEIWHDRDHLLRPSTGYDGLLPATNAPDALTWQETSDKLTTPLEVFGEPSSIQLNTVSENFDWSDNLDWLRSDNVYSGTTENNSETQNLCLTSEEWTSSFDTSFPRVFAESHSWTWVHDSNNAPDQTTDWQKHEMNSLKGENPLCGQSVNRSYQMTVNKNDNDLTCSWMARKDSSDRSCEGQDCSVQIESLSHNQNSFPDDMTNKLDQTSSHSLICSSEVAQTTCTEHTSGDMTADQSAETNDHKNFLDRVDTVYNAFMKMDSDNFSTAEHEEEELNLFPDALHERTVRNLTVSLSDTSSAADRQISEEMKQTLKQNSTTSVDQDFDVTFVEIVDKEHQYSILSDEGVSKTSTHETTENFSNLPLNSCAGHSNGNFDSFDLPFDAADGLPLTKCEDIADVHSMPASLATNQDDNGQYTGNTLDHRDGDMEVEGTDAVTSRQEEMDVLDDVSDIVLDILSTQQQLDDSFWNIEVKTEDTIMKPGGKVVVKEGLRQCITASSDADVKDFNTATPNSTAETSVDPRGEEIDELQVPGKTSPSDAVRDPNHYTVDTRHEVPVSDHSYDHVNREIFDVPTSCQPKSPHSVTEDTGTSVNLGQHKRSKIEHHIGESLELSTSSDTDTKGLTSQTFEAPVDKNMMNEQTERDDVFNRNRTGSHREGKRLSSENTDEHTAAGGLPANPLTAQHKSAIESKSEGSASKYWKEVKSTESSVMTRVVSNDENIGANHNTDEEPPNLKAAYPPISNILRVNDLVHENLVVQNIVKEWANNDWEQIQPCNVNELTETAKDADVQSEEHLIAPSTSDVHPETSSTQDFELSSVPSFGHARATTLLESDGDIPNKCSEESSFDEASNIVAGNIAFQIRTKEEDCLLQRLLFTSDNTRSIEVHESESDSTQFMGSFHGAENEKEPQFKTDPEHIETVSDTGNGEISIPVATSKNNTDSGLRLAGEAATTASSEYRENASADSKHSNTETLPTLSAKVSSLNSSYATLEEDDFHNFVSSTMGVSSGDVHHGAGFIAAQEDSGALSISPRSLVYSEGDSGYFGEKLESLTHMEEIPEDSTATHDMKSESETSSTTHDGDMMTPTEVIESVNARPENFQDVTEDTKLQEDSNTDETDHCTSIVEATDNQEDDACVNASEVATGCDISSNESESQCEPFVQCHHVESKTSSSWTQSSYFRTDVSQEDAPLPEELEQIMQQSDSSEHNSVVVTGMTIHNEATESVSAVVLSDTAELKQSSSVESFVNEGGPKSSSVEFKGTELFADMQERFPTSVDVIETRQPVNLEGETSASTDKETIDRQELRSTSSSEIVETVEPMRDIQRKESTSVDGAMLNMTIEVQGVRSSLVDMKTIISSEHTESLGSTSVDVERTGSSVDIQEDLTSSAVKDVESYVDRQEATSMVSNEEKTDSTSVDVQEMTSTSARDAESYVDRQEVTSMVALEEKTDSTSVDVQEVTSTSFQREMLESSVDMLQLESSSFDVECSDFSFDKPATEAVDLDIGLDVERTQSPALIHVTESSSVYKERAESSTDMQGTESSSEMKMTEGFGNSLKSESTLVDAENLEPLDVQDITYTTKINWKSTTTSIETGKNNALSETVDRSESSADIEEVCITSADAVVTKISVPLQKADSTSVDKELLDQAVDLTIGESPEDLQCTGSVSVNLQSESSSVDLQMIESSSVYCQGTASESIESTPTYLQTTESTSVNLTPSSSIDFQISDSSTTDSQRTESYSGYLGKTESTSVDIQPASSTTMDSDMQRVNTVSVYEQILEAFTSSAEKNERESSVDVELELPRRQPTLTDVKSSSGSATDLKTKSTTADVRSSDSVLTSVARMESRIVTHRAEIHPEDTESADSSLRMQRNEPTPHGTNVLGGLLSKPGTMSAQRHEKHDQVLATVESEGTSVVAVQEEASLVHTDRAESQISLGLPSSSLEGTISGHALKGKQSTPREEEGEESSVDEVDSHTRSTEHPEAADVAGAAAPEPDTAGGGQKADWLLQIYKGVCHVIAKPDMPYMG